MRLLLSALSLVGLLALPGHVHGQYGSAQASAQIGGDVYAAPQADVVLQTPVYRQAAPVVQTQRTTVLRETYQPPPVVRETVTTEYDVPQQDVVYDVAPSCGVSYTLAANGRSFSTGGCNTGAAALANVGVYNNVGANVVVNRGFVTNRGLVRARGVGAQRTVVKSKAVTRTGRAGLLNRVLGR